MECLKTGWNNAKVDGCIENQQPWLEGTNIHERWFKESIPAIYLKDYIIVDPKCTRCKYDYEKMKIETIKNIEWFITPSMLKEREKLKYSLDSLEEVEKYIDSTNEIFNNSH